MRRNPMSRVAGAAVIVLVLPAMAASAAQKPQQQDLSRPVAAGVAGSAQHGGATPVGAADSPPPPMPDLTITEAAAVAVGMGCTRVALTVVNQGAPIPDSAYSELGAGVSFKITNLKYAKTVGLKKLVAIDAGRALQQAAKNTPVVLYLDLIGGESMPWEKAFQSFEIVADPFDTLKEKNVNKNNNTISRNLACQKK